MILPAATTRAQSASHLGLGAGINFYRPTSSEADRSRGISVVYRWHAFHSGWGPTIGFDWHKTRFGEPLESVDGLTAIDAPLGLLHMQAVLLGIGHTQHMRRLSASASVTAGYAFNRLSVDGGAAPAFASVGYSLVNARVRNSSAEKAEVSVWYDLTHRVGIGFTAADLIARPVATTTTVDGSSARHLRADTAELHVGLTFALWKDHR